jgi:hypothetical protein
LTGTNFRGSVHPDHSGLDAAAGRAVTFSRHLRCGTHPPSWQRKVKSRQTRSAARVVLCSFRLFSPPAAATSLLSSLLVSTSSPPPTPLTPPLGARQSFIRPSGTQSLLCMHPSRHATSHAPRGTSRPLAARPAPPLPREEPSLSCPYLRTAAAAFLIVASLASSLRLERAERARH